MAISCQPRFESENMKLDTNIRLESYVENSVIQREFNYAGVIGWAEIIGWQIIVFRRNKGR